jgi:hypothetical protein
VQPEIMIESPSGVRIKGDQASSDERNGSAMPTFRRVNRGSSQLEDNRATEHPSRLSFLLVSAALGAPPPWGITSCRPPSSQYIPLPAALPVDPHSRQESDRGACTALWFD